VSDNTETPTLELSGDASKAQQVTAKVVGVLAAHLGIRPDEIQLQSKLVDDCGADSLDAIEIQFALEDVIGAEIPDEEVPGWKTVGDIVASILRLTK
jgi:acyl carrier protein